MKTLKPCLSLLAMVVVGTLAGCSMKSTQVRRCFRQHPHIAGSGWPQRCLGNSGSRQGCRNPGRTRGGRR